MNRTSTFHEWPAQFFQLPIFSNKNYMNLFYFQTAHMPLILDTDFGYLISNGCHFFYILNTKIPM